MCGILGIVAEPGRAVGLELRHVEAMRDTMRARGPDDAGLFLGRNVAFAHRRLAIRDLAGGAQPWFSPDRQCVLVYNGENYNDAPLRDELARMGYVFRTRCDTEVVMAAYLAWGRDFVERLNGMFALGLYDFRSEELLLARDRFGVKPLFVTEIDGNVAFASSVSALVAHPRFKREPNLPAISHYLTTFRLTLGRQTLFAGVEQVLPAERWIWDGESLDIETYWKYPETDDPALDPRAARDYLADGLRRAVRTQLTSDVPVGMFLSGGVDSNTLACLVRETTSAPMVGKCAGGDMPRLGQSLRIDAAHDDFTHARRCAAHVGFEFDDVRVTADEYRQVWERLVNEQALPLATPTDVIIYRLAQEMRRSVGVVLGGEGADELLRGYAVQHWAGRDYDRLRALEQGGWPHTPAGARLFRSSLQRQYGRATFDSRVDHYFALNSLIPTSAKPFLLRDWAWRDAGRDEPIRAQYQSQFDALTGQPTTRQHALLLHRINLESLLSRLDSATMAAGLEARVPYTDHDLVETMFRVPEAHLIDVADCEHAPYLASGDLQSRGTLRSKRPLRALAGELMPQGLAQRPKASFPTPVAAWLAGPWSDWARDHILASPFANELFEPEPLRELATHAPQAGMWLWPIVNLCLWGDRQFAA